jgi:hypothetical protein
MALSLSELQAVTDVYYATKEAQDIYFKSNILLYKLMGGENGRSTVPGGKSIDVPLEYGELPSQSFKADTNFLTTKAEILNKAQFPWSAYQSTIVYDLDDNRENSGEAAIVDIVETKLRNAQKTIRKAMAEAVYGSASTVGKDILGLGDLFQSTDTSIAYGGIAEADMAVWSAATDSTAEAISFEVMQKIRRMASIDDDKEGKPNLYITTELLKDAFEATLHTQARYSSAKLVEAGFDNILFGGMPVVTDNKCGAGNMYALNMNFLDFKTHKDYNFPKPTWREAAANQPETMIAYEKWSGNLICTNRKAHALHTGLTAA